MSITITTPEQRLQAAGIDPATAWADDPGLTAAQQAALRALGRSEVQRKYNEVGQYLNTAGQGMGDDGRQAQVAPSAPAGDNPAAMTDEQLQAAIAAFQAQQQQPAVQPEIDYWQHQPAPSQPSGSDIGLQRPDYGQAQQRPAYNFTQQQQSQPMPVQQAQVANMHNSATSTEWKDRMSGLLDMPGFDMPGLLQ